METSNNVKVTNNDGWGNVLSGLGGKQDKTRSTKSIRNEFLTDDDLFSIWTGDGVGSKIISSVADDATREWISIPQDFDNFLSDKLQALDAQCKINEALVWSRLFGGSAILIGYADNQDLAVELNKNKFYDISYLKVYEKPRIRPIFSSIITDPKNPYFEDFEFWRLRRSDGIEFEVHRSRLLIFKGIALPKGLKGGDLEREFWGMSVIQQINDNLSQFGGASQSIANLLLEFNIGVFKISNLAELIAESNVKALQSRIEIINYSKSVINSVLIGENEEFKRDVAGISGLSDLLNVFMSIISGVTGIPMTRLFGISPGGLNATGESDMRNYYDSVQSFQNNKIRTPIQLIINTLNGFYKKIHDQHVRFDFLPILTPSQQDLTKMKKDQADMDKIYIELGVLDIEEVRELRFKNGFSFDTSVND